MVEVNGTRPERTPSCIGSVSTSASNHDRRRHYGDGVNVAARLEAEAPPDGIVISRAVHEAVTGRLKATFSDLGNLALKNIDRSVQAFGVRWDGRRLAAHRPCFVANC